MKNKFLSLEWFKGTAERAIEKVIASKLENLIEQEEQQEEVSLYKNVKLVGNTLTVIMNDGSIYSKPSATEEDYFRITNAKTESDIYKTIMSPEVAGQREKEEADYNRMVALKKGISLLAESDEFVVENNVVYFKGMSRSLPQIMVEELIDLVHSDKDFVNSEKFQSLKRFFMWCCLNPRVEVANELYRFLKENSFRITKQGFFVALRNVVTLHGSPELVHFISNAYNKVKAVWKKNPNEYTVFLENGEYKLVHNDKLFKEETRTSTTCPDCEGEGQFWNDYDCDEEDDTELCETCEGTGEVEEYEYTITIPVNHGKEIGNLTELYLDLPNRAENRFTDDWTKTFDIRIGQVTNMPMEECNWSTQDCAAAGLHFTADQIHYVGCGDQSVLVLINPMKVVGIGEHKGRCYEYLPIMTVPREEATQILHDLSFDTLELDEDYAIRELESLELKAQEGFVVEASKYEFNLPQISMNEIRRIVSSLDDMKKEISKRVSIIK